jgi:hypothetical protein
MFFISVILLSPVLEGFPSFIWDLPTSRLPFLWIPIKFTPKNSLKNHGSLWPNGLTNLSHTRPIFFNSLTGRKVCYGKFKVLTSGSHLSLCQWSLMMGFELLSTVILWSPMLGSFLHGVKSSSFGTVQVLGCHDFYGPLSALPQQSRLKNHGSLRHSGLMNLSHRWALFPIHLVSKRSVENLEFWLLVQTFPSFYGHWWWASSH